MPKMPTLKQDVEIEVVSEELTKRGYGEIAQLCIQPSMGRYVVELWLRKGDDEVYREVAWEPSEPDRQALGVQWAFENPLEAVLDAIVTDQHRLSEEAASC